MIRRKDGYACLYTKDGGGYHIPLGEHARVREEWKAGRAFVDTVGLFGQPLTIKLGEVQAISYLTAESLAAIAADDREERREAVISGDE